MKYKPKDSFKKARVFLREGTRDVFWVELFESPYYGYVILTSPGLTQTSVVDLSLGKFKYKFDVPFTEKTIEIARKNI